MSIQSETTAQERIENREIFNDMAKTSPIGVQDMGFGPMLYLGDGMWVTKSGYMGEEEELEDLDEEGE